MKKLITIIAVSLLTINAQAQYGGVIRAVNNSNVIGEIQRIGASMKVHDTALVNIQTAMKLKTDSIYTRLGSGVVVSSIPSATQDVLVSIESYIQNIDATSLNLVSLKLKTDSIYKRMYQDSINLAKLSTGVTTTLDSATQRSTIKVSNFPATQPVSLSGNVNTTISDVTKKTLSTQLVSADTGLVVNAVMHGLATGGGGGYKDVKVNPSGALTVDATQSGTWNVNNVSGTISLPTNASTESTSSAIYAEILDQSTNYLSPSKLKLDSIYTRLGTGVIVNSHAVSFTRLKSSTDTVAISGTITATTGATAIFDSTWSATSMTVTNLNSLASSATVGWQSDSVRNNVRKAVDYKINVKLTMSNASPANDKGIYIYIAPFYFDGTNWYAASQGTTTLPTGAQGASTIASPNNLRLLGVLSYTTQNQVCQDNFLLSNAFGNVMPDGFSIIIVNFSGAAVSASGNVVNYSPINKVQR
jgi:hypothetical protein